MSEPARAVSDNLPEARDVPLVLDVDGTLLRTDLLFETFWAGLGTLPRTTLRSTFLHWRNRAKLKEELAEIAPPRFDLLPYNHHVIAEAGAAMADGREVVLASASDRRLVRSLALREGYALRIFASDGRTNLKGSKKAEALADAYGVHGFDYAGNGPEDIAVWERARHALVVGRPAGATRALMGREGTVWLPGGWRLGSLVKALRPHQWVKNILLFLPLIAAHEFGLQTVIPVLWGLAAFSAAASAIYIVNDLLDLEADRLHATKCRRPFAAGDVPLVVGMVASVGMGLFALSVAAALGWAFLATIALYMALSLLYSLRLKRLRWVDVATLATLYTLRVVAGAAAAQVDASIHMLVFVFPIFLTLGCVKRLTELAKVSSEAPLPGRGYGRVDQRDLLNVAWLGVVAAMVIFFTYSTSDQAMDLYPTTWLLWVALVPIFAWLSRMVRLGRDGHMDHDPIVFALRDKAGIGILCFTLSLMFYAAGLWAEWFGL